MTVKEPRRPRPSPPEQPRRARVHRPLGADPSPWDIFLARVFGRPLRYQNRGKSGLVGPQWIHFVIDRLEDLQRGWRWFGQTSIGKRLFGLFVGPIESVRTGFRALALRLGFRDQQADQEMVTAADQQDRGEDSADPTSQEAPRRSYFDAEPLIPRAASLWPGQRSAFKVKGPKDVVPPSSDASPALHRQLGALSRDSSSSRSRSSVELGQAPAERVTDNLENGEPTVRYSSISAIQSPLSMPTPGSQAQFEDESSEVETQHVHIDGEQIREVSSARTPSIRSSSRRPLMSALASLMSKETEPEQVTQIQEIETEPTLSDHHDVSPASRVPGERSSTPVGGVNEGSDPNEQRVGTSPKSRPPSKTKPPLRLSSSTPSIRRRSSELIPVKRNNSATPMTADLQTSAAEKETNFSTDSSEAQHPGFPPASVDGVIHIADRQLLLSLWYVGLKSGVLTVSEGPAGEVGDAVELTLVCEHRIPLQARIVARVGPLLTVRIINVDQIKRYLFGDSF